MIFCKNTLDGCNTLATAFIIGLDGQKRCFCDSCHSKIVTEIHRRLKEEQEFWGRNAAEILRKNALAGNPLRIN